MRVYIHCKTEAGILLADSAVRLDSPRILDGRGEAVGCSMFREQYLAEATARGVRKEDTMNHFWEIDNKLVEDTLFWEEANLDLRQIH